MVSLATKFVNAARLLDAVEYLSYKYGRVRMLSRYLVSARVPYYVLEASSLPRTLLDANLRTDRRTCVCTQSPAANQRPPIVSCASPD